MHGRRVPSAFPANRTGAPQGEEDLRMNPFASCSSNHNRSALSFGSERLYMFAEAGRAVGVRVMTWSHGRAGGRKSVAVLEKADKRS